MAPARREFRDRAPAWQDGAPGHAASSAQISLRYITSHHPVTVEIGRALRDGPLHHADPRRPVLVVQGEHAVFQLAVERLMVVAGRRIHRVADRPAIDAFDASLDPPA